MRLPPGSKFSGGSVAGKILKSHLFNHFYLNKVGIELTFEKFVQSQNFHADRWLQKSCIANLPLFY